jgi:hypothetical protein
MTVDPSQTTPESTPESPPGGENIGPETKPKMRREKRRRSIFFPILLILTGLLLLIYNLNAGSDAFWGMLIKLWPVIFIALGLDNLWRQEGVAGATFLIGVGAIFLLGNFGYLEMSVWQVLFTLWPVMLLGIGIDILIGRRRSLWLNLAGFFLVIAIIAGVLWFAGLTTPGQQIAAGQSVEYELQNATRAEVELAPASGRLILQELHEPDLLLAGSISDPEQGQNITQKFELVDQTAYLSLKAQGGFIYIPGTPSGTDTWDLGITSQVPVKLLVNLGAGEATLSLVQIRLSELNYQIGVGQSAISLPDLTSYSAKVSGAIGLITIDVPDDAGVKIHTSTGLVTRTLPDGYSESADNEYISPNYEQAEKKIELYIDLAIGTLTIK